MTNSAHETLRKDLFGFINTSAKQISSGEEKHESVREKIKRLIEYLEDDLDLLLEQLHTLEQRLEPAAKLPLKKSISSAIIAQFDQLDQALATLTSTMNNVEIELIDSGNSSSSSAISDSTRIHQHGESDEHFSDSGLSQSTDSISLPLMHQQLSNASSVSR